jgi:hypothetical protein
LEKHVFLRMRAASENLWEGTTGGWRGQYDGSAEASFAITILQDEPAAQSFRGELGDR